MNIQISYTNSSNPRNETIDPSQVTPTGEAAYPTSRVLDGSEDHGYAQEWAEPATLPDGRKCYRMYLFGDDDVTSADGTPLEAEDLPWDDDHIVRIILGASN